MALVQFKQGLFAAAPKTADFVGGIYWASDTHQIGVCSATDTYTWYGGNVKGASMVDSVLTITLNDGNPVVLDFSDVASASATMEIFKTIDTSIKTINTTLGNKVDKVTGKGLSTNDFTDALKTKLDGIEAGAEKNIIETVKVNGTALTPDASRAVNVTIPAATVTDVKSGDKVLALANKELSTTLGLTYDSVTKKINLTGIGSAVIASVDATDFIKDGMVENVSFDPSTKILTITFNTESGKEDIEVDLSDLVDTYTAGNGLALTGSAFSIKIDPTSQSYLTVGTAGLKLTGVASSAELTTYKTAADASIDALQSSMTAVQTKNTQQDSSITAIKAYTINGKAISSNPVLDASLIDLSTGYAMPASYAAPAIGDDLATAIGKLARGVATAQTSGVTSVGGQSGAITVRGGLSTNGSVNLTMSGKEIQAFIVGLGSAAYTASTVYATAAQGKKADSALQSADIASGSGNGTIAVKGTDVAVKGLGSAAYTASSAYDVAGAANTVKTQVIGSASDASTANTIYGAKKYADAVAEASKLTWIEL